MSVYVYCFEVLYLSTSELFIGIVLTKLFRTVKSLSKAIEAYFTNSDIPPENKTALPGDINELAQQLVTSNDDSPADFSKLHEELLRLQQLAGEHKIKDAVFLECLALLAPHLSNDEHLEQWFKAYVNPAINSAGHHIDVVTASQNFFLSMLKNGTQDLAKPQSGSKDKAHMNPTPLSDEIIIKTPSQLYFYLIFDLYQGTILKRFDIEEEGLSLAERKRFIAKNARDLLAKYGSLFPYEFFINLNRKALNPENRLKVFSLVSNLIGQFPETDLSIVAKTPFMDTLFNCLLFDNSSTVLHMCMTIVSMLIPYIASSVKVSKLLVVFGRIASWYTQKSVDFESALPDTLFTSSQDKQSQPSESKKPGEADKVLGEVEMNSTDGQSDTKPESDTLLKEAEMFKEVTVLLSNGINDEVVENYISTDSTSKTWKSLDQAFGLPDMRTADVLPLFTMIYGLFPYSLLAFSKSPASFLRSINYTESLPHNWDDYRITVSIKSLFPCHSLNPFMVSYSAEQELNDESRWNRMGSAKDLAVHCLGLYTRPPTVKTRENSLALSTELGTPDYSQKAAMQSQSLLEALENEYNEVSPEGSERQSSKTNLNQVDTGSVTASLSSTTSRVDSPITTVRHTSSSAGNANLMSYLSPTLKNVDDLLGEHHRLFKRRSNTDEYAPSVLDSINHSDTSLNIPSRRWIQSSTAGSPLIHPISTTQDAMMASPLLIAQSEPSSSVTPLTVRSPSVTTNNTAATQRNELDNDPEPLRLSPTTLATVNEGEKGDEIQTSHPSLPQTQKRIYKQKSTGNTDSTILFYQRELMLLKNEFDFVLYLARHTQYQYSKLLEDRAKDATYNGSIGDLILANQVLRRKVFALDQNFRDAQKRMKLFQRDSTQYESNLLKSNGDMRTLQQELSRKVSKLELDLETSRKESNELFDSIIKKETKISELEFNITELSSESMLAQSYKKALADADEKVISLEQKTANFLSPEESDQVANFLARIKELTSARDAAEYSRKTAELQFRRQISNLQAQIRDYQDKQKNPSSKLTQSFEDFKRGADEQYNQLASAHKDLAERYADLNDEFRKYITAEEVSRGNESKARGGSSSNPRSLLGYDLSSEMSGVTQANFFPETSSARSSTSGNSIGATSHNFSSPPPQSSSSSGKLKKVPTASIQIEHQTRIRGRGGIQNTIRKKEQPQPQINPTRSGVGQFRGFM